VTVGCDGNQGAVLSPAAVMRVSDIPVPKGFSFVQKESWNTSTRSARRVKHLYQGRADAGLVAEFYRTHLPSYGWGVSDDTFDRGTYRFTCSKKGENCVVSIWKSVWHTKVMIQIFPLATK